MLQSFLGGAIFLASLVVCFFFLNFWRKARDTLFLMFGLAFGLIAIERAVLVFISAGSEVKPYIYLTRLIAFSLIGLAVIFKNRR